MKENPLLKGCRAKLPPLDLFDEKITNLKAIQAEIVKIPSPKVIDWLKIDLKPMITSLDAKVMLWIRVYTDFLVHEFKNTLKNV